MDFDYLKPAHSTLSRRARRALLAHDRQRKQGEPNVNSISPPYSVSVADTTRLPSASVWASCPWNEFADYGAPLIWDDFTVIGSAGSAAGGALAASAGRWATYSYQGGTITDAQKEGGVIKLASDGADEGVTLLSHAGSFAFSTSNSAATARPKMWFECRINKSSITTAHLTCFAGLMNPTLSSGLPAAAQPLTTTDDIPMTAGDLFGFLLSGTANGTTGGTMTEVGVAFVTASGTINYPTNLQTLMASTGNTVLAATTFVKLGWIFDPNGPYKRITAATARQTAGTVRRALIRFYVNGVEAPTFLTSDDVYNATATQAFPPTYMCPVFSMMNEASASSDYMGVDWIKIAQRPSTS